MDFVNAKNQKIELGQIDMNINERILTELKDRGEKRQDLADAINEPRNTFSNWLKKGNTLLKYANTLLGIANYFGWSIDYLVTGQEKNSLLSKDEQQLLDLYKKLSKEDQIRILERIQTLYDLTNQKESGNSIIITQPKRVYIDIATIAAGAGISTLFTEDDSFEKKSFDIDDVPRGADCGIPINGESMQPNYPNGCIVWVNKKSPLRYGDDVIVIVNGEPLCKIYQKDGLYSYNSKFKPISVVGDNNIVYFGKVVGSYDE